MDNIYYILNIVTLPLYCASKTLIKQMWRFPHAFGITHMEISTTKLQNWRCDILVLSPLWTAIFHWDQYLLAISIRIIVFNFPKGPWISLVPRSLPDGLSLLIGTLSLTSRSSSVYGGTRTDDVSDFLTLLTIQSIYLLKCVNLSLLANNSSSKNLSYSWY